MPKAKPSLQGGVIVHRIELQETERATLEAALAGRFVTNTVSAVGGVLSGIGSALAPFSGAISALAALWIADRSWDQIKEKVLDPIVESIQRPHLERYAGDYEMISAWLNAAYAHDDWGFLQVDNSSREAYMMSSEFVSTLWRNGDVSHPTLGEFGSAEGFGGAEYEQWAKTGHMPGWLVDRFDSFIWTMKMNTAGEREGKSPAEWWTIFYPYSEFENEIIWNAKNRG